MRRGAPLPSRFAASAGGASAVEFGLIAAPLLAILLGTMEFGRLLWTREALAQTAIAGARCMGMTQTNCGVAGVYSSLLTQNYVISQAALWSITLTASNITLNTSPPQSTTDPTKTACGDPWVSPAPTKGAFAQVKITYAFQSVVPQFITSLASANLSTSACFPNHL